MGYNGYLREWTQSARDLYPSHSYKYDSSSNSVVQWTEELKEKIKSKIEPKIQSIPEIVDSHDKDRIKILKETHEGEKKLSIAELIKEYKNITKETDFIELSIKYVDLFELIKRILNAMENYHSGNKARFNYSDDEIEFLRDIDKYEKMMNIILNAFKDMTERTLTDKKQRIEDENGDINDYIDYT